MTTTQAAPRATRREWIGLAVLALPTLLLSLDVSVLYLAVPQLSSNLGATSTDQLWIMDIYSFMLAGFLVTMGTLGDRIGRRKLLLIGGVAFGAMSILAAYSSSPEMLIVSRALLGIAGATLMPSTMALIRNMFQDPKQMGAALSVWFSCFMGGMALGPLVGGILLENFWWGSAFLLGVPFMVLLVIVAPFLLPEYRDANAGRLDLFSVVLSLGTIMPVIYGLKELAREGVAAVPVASVLIGVLVGVAFIRRQQTLEHPLLDLRLFTNKVFNTGMGIMLFSGVVMAGSSLLASVYLQSVQGFSPLKAGLWLIPQNVVMLIGFTVAPMLANRFRPAYVMASGLAIAGLGLFLHTQVDRVGGLDLLVAGFVLAAFGIALPMALTANLIMGAAPPEKAGSAASVMETSGEFGIALGVATLGSLATYVYRSELSDRVSAETPADSVENAKEGLAAALNTAQQLPGRLAGDLIEGAQAAFTTGLNTAGGVGALIFFGLAALAATAFRELPATGSAQPAEEPAAEAEAPAEEKVAV